jgi:hypothetical protein
MLAASIELVMLENHLRMDALLPQCVRQIHC